MGARLPRERKYLTREEFAHLHGASAADVEKLRAFAAQYGLKVVSEDRGRRMVKLAGTVQAFSEAFGVDLRRYEHSAGAYRCRAGSLTIPADLEPIVKGVFGLDNRPQAKTHFRLRKKKPSVPLGQQPLLTRRFKLRKRTGSPRARPARGSASR